MELITRRKSNIAVALILSLCVVIGAVLYFTHRTGRSDIDPSSFLLNEHDLPEGALWAEAPDTDPLFQKIFDDCREALHVSRPAKTSSRFLFLLPDSDMVTFDQVVSTYGTDSDAITRRNMEESLDRCSDEGINQGHADRDSVAISNASVSKIHIDGVDDSLVTALTREQTQTSRDASSNVKVTHVYQDIILIQSGRVFIRIDLLRTPSMSAAPEKLLRDLAMKAASHIRNQ